MADKKICEINIGGTVYDLKDPNTYTKSEIDTKISSGVQFLGTVNSVASLTALTNAGYGDFVRATAEFTFTDITGSSVTTHIGDTIMLEVNASSAYSSAANWRVLHDKGECYTLVTNAEIDSMME